MSTQLIEKTPIDLRAAVRGRLAQVMFLMPLRLHDFSKDECIELGEGTSASFTQGVRLNGAVAIFLNHWGWARPHNRYSFAVFDQAIDGRWEQVRSRIDYIDEAVALAIHVLAEHALIAAGAAHDR